MFEELNRELIEIKEKLRLRRKLLRDIEKTQSMLAEKNSRLKELESVLESTSLHLLEIGWRAGPAGTGNAKRAASVWKRPSGGDPLCSSGVLDTYHIICMHTAGVLGNPGGPGFGWEAGFDHRPRGRHTLSALW